MSEVIKNERQMEERLKTPGELPASLNRIYDEIYDTHMNKLLDTPDPKDEETAQRLFH